MAALIDVTELGGRLCAELYEGGVVWVIETSDVPGACYVAELKLTAAAAIRLLDFLQLYEERLVRERDGFTP
jgi:hypothetical protein